jgi:hypothetical protein
VIDAAAVVRNFGPSEAARAQHPRLNVAVYFGAESAFTPIVPNPDKRAIGNVPLSGIRRVNGQERCLFIHFVAIAESGIHTIVVFARY